jgi:hypothetical protein
VGVHWLHLYQDGDKSHAPLKKVMNLRVLKMRGMSRVVEGILVYEEKCWYRQLTVLVSAMVQISTCFRRDARRRRVQQVVSWRTGFHGALRDAEIELPAREYFL